MDALPPFPGFTPAAFEFLTGLAEHNERDWFLPRKTVFEDEVRWPLRCLVAELAAEARRRGLPFAGSPETSLFRIYRDTRFSKDKTPYKTHASAWLTRSGEKNAPGGFYMRLKPGACLLAVGIWEPDGPMLRQIRARFAADPDLGPALSARLAARGLTFEPESALKRLPRGFEDHADSPAAPYLRWKSFLAQRPLPDTAFLDRTLVDQALDVRDAGQVVMELGQG